MQYAVEHLPDRTGIWKTGVPGEKPLAARTSTNNKLNPHMTPSPGIEPGPHWWEAYMGGEYSHHCTIPAPKFGILTSLIMLTHILAS